MEVILLERVAKLGQMGEVVRVRDGYARNFLLKRNKALRATADNRAKFDGMKAELEARNLQAKGEATKVAEKIDGRNVVVLRQASETGQLFGSVTVRDIIASFEADGVTISRSQVMLDAPIKTIGKHNIAIAVHPEVEVAVSVTVARSADEAERINRGEDISTASGRSGRRRRSARRRRRILRSGSPPTTTSRRKTQLPTSNAARTCSTNTKPGLRPGLGFLPSPSRRQHRDRRQRGRGVFLDAVDDAKHIGGHHRDLPSGLDHARAADQPLAGRRRQQIQFVFRRQRRLAARGRRRDRGRIVDQEGGDAAMEQAVLLQQLRPPVDRQRAGAARQLGQFGADMAHKSLPADTVADSLCDRREVRIDARFGIRVMACLRCLQWLAARPARGSRRRSGCRPEACGSVRSRPDSQARQKICAGPMIWLKNSVGVIGSNSPRAISGARQRSTPSPRREFCAALRVCGPLRSIRCAKSRTESAPRAGCSPPSPDARGSERIDAVPRAAGRDRSPPASPA